MSGLVEALNRVTNRGKEIYSTVGKVTKVDEKKRICTVEPVDGAAALYGVRLQSALNSEVGLCLVPKKGSNVVVTFLNNKTGYVAMCEELEAVFLVIGSQKIELDKDGLSWMVQQNSLKGLVEELIDILLNFQLSTNMGATIAVMPHLVARLQVLKSGFNSFLK